MPNTITYRPRWRNDATGEVERFAGQWASSYPYHDLQELELKISEMPNGSDVEIVEV